MSKTSLRCLVPLVAAVFALAGCAAGAEEGSPSNQEDAEEEGVGSASSELAVASCNNKPLKLQKAECFIRWAREDNATYNRAGCKLSAEGSAVSTFDPNPGKYWVMQCRRSSSKVVFREGKKLLGKAITQEGTAITIRI